LEVGGFFFFRFLNISGTVNSCLFLGRLKNDIKQNNIDLNIVHIYIINKYKITSVLKSEIYNITSIPESPRCESIGLAAILVIMYVDTFKANVIMCVM
jgi:hypothetical protein